MLSSLGTMISVIGFITTIIMVNFRNNSKLAQICSLVWMANSIIAWFIITRNWDVIKKDPLV